MDLAAILARIEKRLKAVGLTGNAASKAAGKPDAIRNLQRAVKDGKRQGISSATLSALARILRTRESWLIDGSGPEEDGQLHLIRLAGCVRAGSATILYSESNETDEWVEPPAALGADAFALEIRGDSLGPLFEGWLIFVNDRREKIARDMLNALCVVGLEDGRVVVKKVTKGQLDDRFNLLSNTEPPIYDACVLWAAKVRQITPRR